jgi:hypothetical protein
MDGSEISIVGALTGVFVAIWLSFANKSGKIVSFELDDLGFLVGVLFGSFILVMMNLQNPNSYREDVVTNILLLLFIAFFLIFLLWLRRSKKKYGEMLKKIANKYGGTTDGKHFGTEYKEREIHIWREVSSKAGYVTYIAVEHWTKNVLDFHISPNTQFHGLSRMMGAEYTSTNQESFDKKVLITGKDGDSFARLVSDNLKNQIAKVKFGSFLSPAYINNQGWHVRYETHTILTDPIEAERIITALYGLAEIVDKYGEKQKR